MKNIIKSILPKSLWSDLSLFKFSRQWQSELFCSPSPHPIKIATLLRNGIPGATWVETGTFRGDTTSILAKHSPCIYTIEPSEALFQKAKSFLSKHPNITVINGTSEGIFPSLLPKISGDINFWLDGHFSGGPTFKANLDTPIIAELENIASNLVNFNKVCILIDDVRCFNPRDSRFSHYPDLGLLVDWARDHNFFWTIEHDIFIAKNF